MTADAIPPADATFTAREREAAADLLNKLYSLESRYKRGELPECLADLLSEFRSEVSGFCDLQPYHRGITDPDPDGDCER